MDRAKLDEIVAITSDALLDSNFECVEAQWVPAERTLRLYVDHVGADNAVTIIDCVTATKVLKEFEKLDQMIDGKYNLEVSSPGVERPLRKIEHFERRIGEKVKVSLIKKSSERREGSGEILSVNTAGDDTVVTLATAQGEWSFSLHNLKRAELVFDWDK